MNAQTAGSATPEPTPIIYVIEDDATNRDALAALFETTGEVVLFSSAEEFLIHHRRPAPSCLLVDQRLPGLSGSELLCRLSQEKRSLPAVLVTAFADTPSTVEAMQCGALTVLEKPCANSVLRSAIVNAIEIDRRRRKQAQRKEASAEAIAQLTENELEVLQMVLDGVPNKQIARRMGVCVRTIESRRSRIYRGTGVTSVAELVRLCVSAGFIDD